MAAMPAPGYEDNWEQVSVSYDSGCTFQYAYSNPQTGEVRYETATVGDVKKQATLIICGEYDSDNVFTQIGFSFTDLWGKSMAFYQRAYCYLRRKKSKSIVLFSCFLAISTLILCAAMILQTAESVNRSIREKTGSKIILEDRRGQNSISAETVSHLLSLPAVTKINRTASSTAYPADFSPIIKKESADPLNLSVTLHSCDNTEIDGLFAQEKYRLLEGTHITGCPERHFNQFHSCPGKWSWNRRYNHVGNRNRRYRLRRDYRNFLFRYGAQAGGQCGSSIPD